MTIIDRVRNFYYNNSSELNSYLEETSFLNVNAKYPNSVVIKFGKDKLIGEISVWQHNDTESYYECEYINLTNLDKKLVNLNKRITGETVVDELTKQFSILYKLCENNYPRDLKEITITKENFYKFLESKIGMPINDETVFFEGTGLDGLDAISLMEEILTKFNVDLSTYNPNDFHLQESQLFNPFFIFNRKKNKKKTFTGKHLFEVVNLGKWFPPTS